MKVYTNKKKLLDERIFDEALFVTDNNVDCTSIGVRFVSKRTIKKLNKLHRGIDKITDVLSFPLLDTFRASCLKNFENERDPLTKELELGDIVICMAVAKKQAKKYGHSIEREVNFLALHGLLHLLGYDHIKKKDEVEMTSLAEKILADFGYNRGGHV